VFSFFQTLLQISHMRIDRASEQTTKDDCSFGIRTGPVGQLLNCTAYGQLRPVLSTYFKKKIIGARICPVYLSEFIVSEKKIDPTILVALTAHYTPNLTSCNGTSYISIESSADQYLLF